MTGLLQLAFALAAAWPCPEARAPFAYEGRARQETELIEFNFRPHPFGAPVYRDWREYRSGDRSVMIAGLDRRLKDKGEIGVYRGKHAAAKPGDELLYAIRLGGEPASTASTGPGVVEIVCAAGQVPAVTKLVEDAGDVTVEVRPGDPAKIVVDLGEARRPVVTPTPPVEGMDFWWTDAVHVPVRPDGNLVANGGFEKGLEGWISHFQAKWWNAIVADGGWDFELVDEAHSGAKAIRFRTLSTNSFERIFSAPMPLKPGRKYVLSYWVKGVEPRGWGLNVGPVPASTRGDADGWKFEPVKTGRGGKVGREWSRREQTFVPSKPGMCVVIGAWQPVDVVIDDIRVEEGEAATDRPAPTVARLRSPFRFNHLPKGMRAGLEVALAGAPGTTGTVTVAIKNFYSETVARGRRAYALGADGTASFAMKTAAFADRPGLYVVRFDHEEDGRRWTDYTRFSVVDPVGCAHPTASFFCTFGWHERGPLGPELADFKRDFGWGATSWMTDRSFVEGPCAELWKRAKTVPYVHIVYTELARYCPKEFGWAKPNFRDYTNVVPEKVEFIEKAAYRAGKECREDDVWWTLGNEEELGYPVIKARKDFDTWAAYQHAAYRGLKRAFDERGLKLRYAPTHGTCSVSRNPGAGIDVLRNYILAARRRGFEYDFISAHHYWAIDGSDFGSWMDRDEDSQALEKMMDENGMAGKPYMYPESYNLVENYLPAWNAVDWHDNYNGTIPSLDLSNREFNHAAVMARMYLIDLKRWPRLKTTHNWMNLPYLDLEGNQAAWSFVANTLGRLLPDPRYAGEHRPATDIRGYVYRPSPGAKGGVLAVWTTDRAVENGAKKGPVVAMTLPRPARFTDLMGAERAGSARFPLTTAPLFIEYDDADELLAAFKACEVEGAAESAADLPAVARQAVPVVRTEGAVDWAAIAEAAPGVKLAWSGRAFLLRLEARGARAVKLGLDGLGDADRTGDRLGPDDSVYEFREGEIRRVKAVNTQFADGTTNAADEDEVRRDFVRRFRPVGDGGVWELEIVPRFLTPTRLEQGFTAGVGVAFGEDELASPRRWTAVRFAGKDGR